MIVGFSTLLLAHQFTEILEQILILMQVKSVSSFYHGKERPIKDVVKKKHVLWLERSFNYRHY